MEKKNLFSSKELSQSSSVVTRETIPYFSVKRMRTRNGRLFHEYISTEFEAHYFPRISSKDVYLYSSNRLGTVPRYAYAHVMPRAIDLIL